MLEADVCVLTTPGLDVLQIHRSPGVRHYAHLVHSATDMAIYKLFSFDWFDSVLCSGPHQMRSLRALGRACAGRRKNSCWKPAAPIWTCWRIAWTPPLGIKRMRPGKRS